MERILVVEDERKLNDILRDYLVSLGYEVVQRFTGPDALAAVEAEAFDLAVLDLMLPGLDGIEVARRIRAGSALPIIMLTARDSEADKLLGLEIGADDYLAKPFSVRELGARIRAVLRRCGAPRQENGCGDVLSHGRLVLDAAKRTVLKDGRPVELTPAQFDLLRILLKFPGRVYTRGELISELSGYEYEGYERTVDVHVKNLRKAIESDPANPSLLLTVWGVGYKVQE
jgi:two-component system phosphate regulon response regulator OmpR